MRLVRRAYRPRDNSTGRFRSHTSNLRSADFVVFIGANDLPCETGSGMTVEDVVEERRIEEHSRSGWMLHKLIRKHILLHSVIGARISSFPGNWARLSRHAFKETINLRDRKARSAPAQQRTSEKSLAEFRPRQNRVSLVRISGFVPTISC